MDVSQEVGNGDAKGGDAKGGDEIEKNNKDVPGGVIREVKIVKDDMNADTARTGTAHSTARYYYLFIFIFFFSSCLIGNVYSTKVLVYREFTDGWNK